MSGGTCKQLTTIDTIDRVQSTTNAAKHGLKAMYTIRNNKTG